MDGIETVNTSSSLWILTTKKESDREFHLCVVDPVKCLWGEKHPWLPALCGGALKASMRRKMTMNASSVFEACKVATREESYHECHLWVVEPVTWIWGEKQLWIPSLCGGASNVNMRREATMNASSVWWSIKVIMRGEKQPWMPALCW